MRRPRKKRVVRKIRKKKVVRKIRKMRKLKKMRMMSRKRRRILSWSSTANPRSNLVTSQSTVFRNELQRRIYKKISTTTSSRPRMLERKSGNLMVMRTTRSSSRSVRLRKHHRSGHVPESLSTKIKMEKRSSRNCIKQIESLLSVLKLSRSTPRPSKPKSSRNCPMAPKFASPETSVEWNLYFVRKKLFSKDWRFMQMKMEMRAVLRRM